MPSIERFTSADIKDLDYLKPADWGDIRPGFNDCLCTDICYPVKLVEDSKSIGIGVASEHGSTGWLGHIVVHPDYQSRGYGKLITQWLMNYLHKRNVRTIILVATEQGQPLYEKLGFIPECSYHFFRNESANIPSPEMHHMHSFTPEHQKALLDLDKHITGEDRKKWILPHIYKAMLYLQGKEILAYYIPTLGDGLIGSLEIEPGINFMKLRLQTHTTTIIPTENTNAVSFLDQHGFKVYRKARRMWLGEKLVWHPECIYSRISGSLG